MYTLTGSALATGGTFIAESLPSILFGSVAGVFVDRWDRRRTMIASDVLRAILLLGLLTVRSPETVWVVFAVSFAQSTIGQLFGPAKNALIPRLVGEEDLLAANSLSSMGNQLTMLTGPLLGGASLALLGIFSSILVDSASFLFSAIMAAYVVAAPLSNEPTTESARGSSAWGRAWRDYRAGPTRIAAGCWAPMGPPNLPCCSRAWRCLVRSAALSGRSQLWSSLACCTRQAGSPLR